MNGNEDLLIRLVEAAERIAAALEKMTGTPGEKVQHITGYTVGEYSDNNSGSFQPCVHLWYGPPLKFAVATVYPEKFDQLPFPVSHAEWTGGALDYELALKKNVVHKWEADVLLAPKMEGEEVKRNPDTGKVVYKFVGVKGHTYMLGKPTTDPPPPSNPPAPPPPPHTGKPSTQPSPTTDPPAPARRTAMNISGKTCPECHAPAGKPHTSKCSKHNG